jgi:hypothetical protein
MALDAVLAAVEARRQQIREQADWAIQGIEAKRDDELAELNLEAMTVSTEEAPTPKPRPKPKSRKGTKVNSPAAAKERAERLATYLTEKGESVTGPEAREATGLSVVEFSTAVKRLEKEGRLTRTGKQQFSRYEATGAKASSESVKPPPVPAANAGTLQGRILAKVEADAFLTLDELVEATGANSEEVLRECGLLIREGEIRMERRSGRPGYAPTI